MEPAAITNSNILLASYLKYLDEAYSKNNQSSVLLVKLAIQGFTESFV